MRETLRGALLSVLFFALLVGGAPGVATADLQMVTSAHVSPTECGSMGGLWVPGDGTGINPAGYCDTDITQHEFGTPEWCQGAGHLLAFLGFDAALFTGAAGLVAWTTGRAGLTAFMVGTMGPIGIGLGIAATIGGIYWWYNCG